MSSFVWIFIWFAVVATVAISSRQMRVEEVCGNKVYRYDVWIILVALAPIILMTATRTDSFGDTMVYRESFKNMPLVLDGMSEYMKTVTKDYGFSIASILIKCVIGQNEVLYFGILAFIQGIIVFMVFRKYSINVWVTIFMFLASSDYVAWMYNGIRQFTAVVIIFAGTRLFLDKKYIRSILLICFAATMHRSALLMIPFIFIAQGRAWNKKTILLVIMAVLAVVFVDRFTTFLQSALEETQYTNVVSDYIDFNDDGTNPIRVLVYSVPAIASLLLKKRIDFENDRVINFCTNMSLISMALYIVSMATSGIFLGRLPIYASLYSYILLPWLIEKSFTEQSAKIVYTIMGILYLLFYYYQMHFTWGIL